jgi:hypothetical protein
MKFTLSNVLNGGFSNLGKAFVPLLLTALILYVVPTVAINAGLRYGLGVTLGTPEAFTAGNAWMVWVAMLVTYLLTFAHMSAGYEICILTQANKPVNVGEVIAHAAGNAFPIFLIYLLCILGWVIGGALFLVPAFIFGVFYSVVVPAYVAEKPGIFGAFSRSQALTKGHRWAIFGIWVVAVIVFYIAFMVVEVPLTMPTLMASIEAAKHGQHVVPPAPNLIVMAISAVISSVLWVIMLSINASVYSCLRGEKEGLSGEKEGLSGERMEKIFE